MKTLIFALYDIKGAQYGKLILMNTEDLALRSLKGFLNDPQSKESDPVKYPEDFQLHQLGEFDDESGIIKGLKQAKFIATLVQLKNQIKQEEPISN